MSLRKFLRLTIPVVFVFLLVGCVPPAKTPMNTVFFTATEPARNPVLLIFLPGKGDNPESYETEGFVKAVKKLNLPVDMLGADAHIGYYLKGNFPERLEKDVIIPAKAKGYERIWLIGISLGGLGVLWYDGKYPGEVEGLVSLSPYLGEPEMGREVSKAGGLASWKPSHIAGDDMQRRIWQGLKVYLAPDKTWSRVYLGYGLQDRFAGPDGVFAAVLPDRQVFTCQGGHDWDTWRSLWTKVLDVLDQRWESKRADIEQ
jgi:pimeloyl-ACP methyl ester carboxylesterase